MKKAMTLGEFREATKCLGDEMVLVVIEDSGQSCHVCSLMIQVNGNDDDKKLFIERESQFRAGILGIHKLTGNWMRINNPGEDESSVDVGRNDKLFERSVFGKNLTAGDLWKSVMSRFDKSARLTVADKDGKTYSVRMISGNDKQLQIVASHEEVKGNIAEDQIKSFPEM